MPPSNSIDAGLPIEEELLPVMAGLLHRSHPDTFIRVRHLAGRQYTVTCTGDLDQDAVKAEIVNLGLELLLDLLELQHFVNRKRAA